MNDYNASLKVASEYLELCDLYREKTCKMNFQIQCQRRFHIGYMYIKNLLNEIVKEYGIPITYIDIYHCDGMWNMPNEFFTRENHPYKYGYGKLFHSGYHFVDLLAWLLECNDSLKNKINNVDLYATSFKVSDFFNTVNNDFYEKFMDTNKFRDIIDNKDIVKDFGELDIHSMFDFKYNDQITTHCSLNLMQSGFSKRAWVDLPLDTYKSNGRIRHERINIQVGPLLNIQVHSYQAKEIGEATKNSYSTGEIDHFDIYIFRNTKIIGGKDFEKISIKDLLKKSHNDFLGNNEKAREMCFLDFLNDKKMGSDLLSHQKGILLLTKLCEINALKKSKISFEWSDYYE